MKKRILALALTLVLLIGVLATPASAATGKEVFNYLKSIAQEGDYDSENNWYYSSFNVGSNVYYGVFYLVSQNYIEATIFNSSLEVTWRISSNPSPAYTAFILVYDDQGTKGTVNIAAGYNGSAYSSFKSFSGNTAYKSQMLEILNELLPAVVEFTRAVINDNDYTLKDLGLTGYKKCSYVHAYDKGKITQQPTCAEQGLLTYTCRVCGTTYTEAIEPTYQHKMDKGTVITEPTCTTTGLKRYCCKTCGNQMKDETLPALGHAWTYTETVSTGDSLHAGTGLYTCTRCQETKEDKLCASVVFTDMPPEGNWAHAPIDWAYFSGITAGKGEGTFAPKDTVTRAEVMTFLWVTLHRPEPETTDNPFTDVPAGKYFYKPVLWAVENNITGGTSETTFEPNASCNRAQVVTFLYKAKDILNAPQPEPETP